jgi:hypothetical protein
MAGSRAVVAPTVGISLHAGMHSGESEASVGESLPVRGAAAGGDGGLTKFPAVVFCIS